MPQTAERPSRPPAAIAIRHVAFEDLGLLAPILADAGFAVAYRDAPIADLGEPAIAAADLLIVLGGPIGVYEAAAYPFLTREIALLERRMRDGRPTLGICLGAQLMAKALGARVYAGPVKEIGWSPVTLTDAGRASCLAPLGAANAPVLHWHGDTFDLPAGAVRLASTAASENQAFAHGAHALALQFHAEAEPDGLEYWYVGHAVELAAAGIPVPGLRATTRALAEGVRARARAIFAAWLRAQPQLVTLPATSTGLGR
jgi:GMP synthase (glutamine-hydrolysing)